MPDRLIELPQVRARGRWRGNVVDGDARLRLDPDVLQLVPSQSTLIRIEFDALSGSEWRLGTLSLFANGDRPLASDPDDTIELTDDALLGDVWTMLGEYACALPELTRAMRSLGSRRGGSRVLQERFFAPLLQARRRLEIDARLEWRLAAFEAPVLRAHMEALLLSFAAEMHPRSAPDRRALEAELQERSARLLPRFEQLDEAASEVHDSPDRTRYAAWRRWANAARNVFDEADRCWISCQSLVREVASR